MTIKEFIEKRFKDEPHKSLCEHYLLLHGVHTKSLWKYIQKFFWIREENDTTFAQMSVDDMDEYIESLVELMS